MTPTEAVTLCRYVRAACPQQAMDEYTPQAWADLLGDLRIEDAREAARNLGKRQPFISPSEIRTEVHRIRERRIAEHPEPAPPPDLTPVQTVAWLRDTRRRIADGETITSQPTAELPARVRTLGVIGTKITNGAVVP